MKFSNVVLVIASLCILPFTAGCDENGGKKTENNPPNAETTLSSGLELSGIDRSIRPQDDLHSYANGTWLATTPIPEQYSSYSAFVILKEQAEENQRAIIEEVSAKAATNGTIEQQIGDYYASFMDTPSIETAGIKPLREQLSAIEQVASKQQLINLFAEFIQEGVTAPLSLGISQDLKNAQQYTAYLGQAGLGLPNRDYYLETDNPRFQSVLAQYPDYIASLFSLAGIADATNKASQVVALETNLAKHHWSAIDNRNLEKIYNPLTAKELKNLAAELDWPRFLSAIGIAELEHIIVTQPSYIAGLNQLLASEPLSSWKSYLQSRLLSDYSPYLSDDFVRANFDFYGRVIDGKTQQQDRWRRGIDVTNQALGEAIGRIYVAKHFPPEAKARMQQLVDNLLAEFSTGIDNLDWMGEQTKREAQQKLSKFNVKIGYPDQWRDFSAMAITRNDLIANIRSAHRYHYRYELSKLGKPVDHDEWHMTPQTVNAYYNPGMNEIVFPAAILQPPFFTIDADDAVNYGAIGMVIGHEISHGFDDQGSKFDGDGNLRNWWTDQDRQRFEARTKMLVEQYNKYSPIAGMFVKGELTLGENIGDLSGLTVAYHAYQRSLQGKPAPVIDGYTGDQRFFLGLAQSWRAKYRDEAMTAMLTSNPHSPPRYRVNGVVVNMPEFYQAFDVKDGDGHYLPPAQRVKIW